MVGVAQIGRWHCFKQLLFDLQYSLARCNAKTIAEAKKMRIDRNCRLSENIVQNNICGLAANTGERFQVFSR